MFMLSRKIGVVFVLLIIIVGFAGCAPHVDQEPPLTQLQIREIETRDFDTKDIKLVSKSIVNVFQDEGFVVKNAVLDLGLICAEKSIDIENTQKAFMLYLFVGPDARWQKQQKIEASANISEFGEKTRVRVTFQINEVDNFGRPLNVKTILDSKFHQDFFEKVNKGIFVQQENI